MQIGDSFSDYGKYVGLKHLTIFGGVKQGPQVEALRGGVDILIATPGRLHDLIGQRFVELDAITHFVLDEADRMLDMGFVADIKRLLPLLPKSRQTLFFSATMPADIVALSKSMLTDPVRVEVTPVASAVDAIDQRVYFVEKPEKKKLPAPNTERTIFRVCSPSRVFEARRFMATSRRITASAYSRISSPARSG